MVEMDMSAFPKMLQFQKKLLPHPQLLRWAQWFSRWDFQTKNIKGTNNILADYFSSKPLHSLMPIPLVYLLKPVHDLPFEVRTKVLEFLQTKRSHSNFHTYLEISIFNHGRIFKHIPHPDYSYLIPYCIPNYYHVPLETLCYLWYFFESYSVAFIFDILRLYAYLNQCQINPALTINQAGLMKFLKWFYPIPTWQQMLQVHHCKYAIITFKNPTDIIRDNEEEMVYYTHDARAEIIQWYSYNLMEEYGLHPVDWILFKDHMCTLNQRSYAEIPVMIATDPFADPQHSISEQLFDSLLAFFDRTGFLGDSSVESLPFVGHWDDPTDFDSD